MSHSHSENCHHHHHHNASKGLLVVFLLTSLYMIAEFIGGLYTNSLALTADAGHMLGDVGALALSYFALWVSNRPASSDKTFGYFRAEIFAAFINGLTLVIIALIIIYEAYLRIIHPPEIKSLAMIIIAFGGLIINLIGIFMLRSSSKENLNIKGAFLHIIGDLIGSIGAIVSGLLIFYYHFYLADPIISIFIAGLVLYSSVSLTITSINVLMESAPSHINVKSVEALICGVYGVINVHDLHIWSIDSNKVSLSVHIVADLINSEKILYEVNELLENKFGIYHSTIQIEPKGFHENNCSLKI